MNETKALARFSVETKFADLPASIVDDGKILLLDAFAAAFVGAAQPWAKHTLEVVRGLGGKPDAVVIAHGWKTDISRAAFANGVLIGSFECESVTGSHAAGTIFPAALAVSGLKRASGKQLLTAMVVGAEVSTRIKAATVGLEETRGFHNPSTQGPFGAAAAIGQLLHLDVDKMVNALGLAGSGAGGLMEFASTGADTKRLHLGRASQLGLESALLAAKGVTGPATVLEGRWGFYNAFSLEPKMERVLAGLGRDWTIQPRMMKSYGMHWNCQALIEALQKFRKSGAADLGAVNRVTLQGPSYLFRERHLERHPTSLMGAQYSIPFSVAAAMFNDMSDPLAFNADALNDPKVRKIAEQIEIVATDEAHDDKSPSLAEIYLDIGGRQFTLAVHPHKGSPKNPFSWEDAEEKFKRYTSKIIAADQAGKIAGAVRNLENIPDVSEFMHLLAVSH